MRAVKKIHLLKAIGLLSCFLFEFASPVYGQETYDPIDTIYATGAIFDTEERLSNVLRTPTMRAFLPEIVDLSKRFPRVGNQGEQGSCVAWAVGYAARSYYKAASANQSVLQSDQIASPAYIYNTIRRSDATCGDGTYIADALNLLKKGIVSHQEYPYHENRCARPGSSIITIATRFKIDDWLMVDTTRLDQVRSELANGHPVVIGMRPDLNFHRLRGRTIWKAGDPDKDDGHHAITVVGYHEPGQYFKFINSWGRGWGDRGYGRMSYSTFKKRVKYGYSMRPPEEPLPPKPEPPTPVVPDLVLPGIGCGELNVTKNGNENIISGYVDTKEDLEKVRKVAAEKNAIVKVDLRPWPQCETLMTISEPLAEAEKPSILLPKTSYQEADTLSFDVKMADFQGYLHVAYIQANGKVVNLVESDPLHLSTYAKNTKLTFGDGLEGRPKFTVSGPFGNEMIIVLASKSPLFEDDRPLVETEREFLTALRAAIIARPNPNSSERLVSASFVTLDTKSKE